MKILSRKSEGFFHLETLKFHVQRAGSRERAIIPERESNVGDYVVLLSFEIREKIADLSHRVLCR